MHNHKDSMAKMVLNGRAADEPRYHKQLLTTEPTDKTNIGNRIPVCAKWK